MVLNFFFSKTILRSRYLIFQLRLAHHHLAEHYYELLQKYPNITYVFLPIIPGIRDDSANKSLNRSVQELVSLERRLINELDRNRIDYVDLRDLSLESIDYIDMCHLRKKANLRILEHLKETGYL